MKVAKVRLQRAKVAEGARAFTLQWREGHEASREYEFFPQKGPVTGRTAADGSVTRRTMTERGHLRKPTSSARKKPWINSLSTSEISVYI